MNTKMQKGLKRMAIAIALRYGFVKSALAATLPDRASVDSLPEGQRAWYAEKDGKFSLDLTRIEIEDAPGLKKALNTERDERKKAAKALQELTDKFKDFDPDKFKELQHNAEIAEEKRLIAEGKADEVAKARVARLEAETQKKIDEAGKREKAAVERSAKFAGRVLDNEIRAAVAKAGVHERAIDDALLRARGVFVLDEGGLRAVQLGEDGLPVLGKDGKTPFSPTEWMEGMKEAAPHWFPASSSGGGAGNYNPGAAPSGAIKRAAFESKSSSDKAVFIRGGGKVVD